MPARLRKIVKAAKQYGFSLAAKKGKHAWKLVRDGDRCYPIPAHNGEKTEISDKYIEEFCDQYGIDRDEFKSKL